jgi:lysophospholipase L1-like esterase
VKLTIVAVLTVLAFFIALCEAPSAESNVRREAIEWCDVWIPNSNNADLPRVLLVGDSITKGYYSGVELNLRGKAYVARIATSKAVGDPALLLQLRAFLAETGFEVVHFNIGMHGWAYTEDEYRRNLPDLLAAIRQGAPGAKLIWASTTPVRKDHGAGPTNQRIQNRNLIARDYFTGQGIPIDDLHALMVPHAVVHSDDVDFNSAGCSMLAGTA